MRDLLIQLIGTYTPVQVTNNLYIDIPFTICGILICVVIYAIIRGIFALCNKQ